MVRYMKHAKEISRRNLLKLVMVAATLFLVVCFALDHSEGRRLTKPEYVKQLNALCRAHTARFSKLEPPGTKAELLERIIQEQSIQEEFFSEFRKLRPPIGDQHATDEVMRQSKTVLWYDRHGREAIETGEGNPFEGASQYDSAIWAIDDLLYKNIGAKSCGGD